VLPVFLFEAVSKRLDLLSQQRIFGFEFLDHFRQVVPSRFQTVEFSGGDQTDELLFAATRRSLTVAHLFGGV
jgi:hypothetical protein